MAVIQPDLTALEHSHRLSQLIQSEIKCSFNQSITFARFMELALYAPGLGYYSAGRHKLGAKGDFVTAPEISPLFARCIAHQIKPFLASGGHFLELGGGSGVFAKDIMLELDRQKSLPEHYYLLEVSAELRQRQQLFLAETCPELFSRFVWLDTLPTNFEGVIFANEVLDALPVHCIVKLEKWMERSVTYKKNEWAWHLTTPSQLLQRHLEHLETGCEFAMGYESEINLMAPNLIHTLLSHLNKGILLLFDYGYGRKEYYHPERMQGTLKCFYHHHHHNNPFIHIGLQDITAHVDFTSIAEQGIAAGAQLLGYTTQSAFLLASNLLTLANENENNTVAYYSQAQAIKTLTLPSEMGEIVKVMGFTKNISALLNGFTWVDRRRDL